MTPLSKAVARKSTGLGPNRRRYVVTLAPGDVIGFRDERRRKNYWISIAACYEYAIRAEVARKKAERAKEKKARKK
jgi:hypothetical protein